MSRIIVIGECRLDIDYPADFASGQAFARPSGLMASIALRLAAKGHNVLFLTEAAVDSVGDSVMQYLASHGVDVSHADRYTDGLTPLAACCRGAKPTLYTSYPPTDGFDITWPRLDDKEDIVIFGDYMTLSQRWSRNYLNFMSHVVSKGCQTVYVPGDISWRVSRVTKVMPQVFENLEMASAVMLDPDTCAYYFGTDSPEEALKKTVGYYCPTILFAGAGSATPVEVGKPLPDSLKSLVADILG
ncbi:MAG: hypothetical protein K2I64_04100 [Muribaculaceae bacterium]|nr:hypothetical protein [Muribaculaceae bacterium]